MDFELVAKRRLKAVESTTTTIEMLHEPLEKPNVVYSAPKASILDMMRYGVKKANENKSSDDV